MAHSTHSTASGKLVDLPAGHMVQFVWFANEYVPGAQPSWENELGDQWKPAWQSKLILANRRLVGSAWARQTTAFVIVLPLGTINVASCWRIDAGCDEFCHV